MKRILLNLAISLCCVTTSVSAVVRVPPTRDLPSSSINLLANLAYNTNRCAVEYKDIPRTTSNIGNKLLNIPASTLANSYINGPFKLPNDHSSGSPGEWSRLYANYYSYYNGIKYSSVQNWTLDGSIERDAAFINLIEGNSLVWKFLSDYLINQTRISIRSFPETICIRNLQGPMLDANFNQASWLSRYIITYDMAKPYINPAYIPLIEAFIRKNAYFLATQIDYGLAFIFPNRLNRDYSVRGYSANPINMSEAFLLEKMDLNLDCIKDDGPLSNVHAYTRSDGTVGPKISVLSQWYNNRKAGNITAIALAGVLLNDQELILRSKIYITEWLKYSVYPDGSEGEYARNWDYCISNQGLVYSASNIQAATIVAGILSINGDNYLRLYNTRDGMFGTEGRTYKSIQLVVNTRQNIYSKKLDWYYSNPSVSKPLAESTVYFMNKGSGIDNYHEVGLLLFNKTLGLSVKDWILRKNTYSNIPWPGATGNYVATGMGSAHGAWTDVFNIYPSALIIEQ